MNTYIQEKESDLRAVIDFLKRELAGLRVGRANPSILEGIFVELYGMKNPLNAVCNIAVSDSMSMTLTPWDKETLKAIEKAVVEANLGVGVINEGDKIRLNIPQMTEENRREVVKKVNEKQENARISLRQVRESIKNNIENALKDKEISEDDRFRFVKELDEEVDKINKEIEELRDKKEKEVMEI